MSRHAAFGRSRSGFFGGKKNKHNAVGVRDHGGIFFHSKKEARRYGVLLQLQRLGAIQFLTPHPKFDLVVNGVWVASYTADSGYVENGGYVVEDVKSSHTAGFADYRMKKALMLAVHGIAIKEII